MACVLAATSLVLVPGDAFACSCAEPLSDTEAEAGSDAVFAGTVIGHEITKPVGGEYTPAIDDVRMALEVEWTVAVDTYVKGVPAEEITIASSGQGTACGFQFDVGKRYLVFAYEKERGGGELATNSCTNTRTIDAGEHVPGTPIEELALPEVPPADMPRETENPWPPIITLGLGIVAAVLVGRRFIAPEDDSF